jgi:cell wall-associated NlpC family hydrolase
VVGLAYGFSASGSTTAYAHWNAIPSQYKYAGVTTVPAGGLAFFSSGSGAGHVMLSTGGGQFASSDIHGNGTYSYTTISEIENTWGEHYLGWAQPWFQANH